MPRIQKEKQPKEAQEEIVEIEVPEKRDLKDIDMLLDEIDEVLEEDTVAEMIAKAEYKEKLRTIQFPGRRRSEVPVTLQVTNIITCEFRCENCTCGR